MIIITYTLEASILLSFNLKASWSIWIHHLISIMTFHPSILTVSDRTKFLTRWKLDHSYMHLFYNTQSWNSPLTRLLAWVTFLFTQIAKIYRLPFAKYMECQSPHKQTSMAWHHTCLVHSCKSLEPHESPDLLGKKCHDCVGYFASRKDTEYPYHKKRFRTHHCTTNQLGEIFKG